MNNKFENENEEEKLFKKPFLDRTLHENTGPNLCFSISYISQGLQILLMSGVSVTSASQILESLWNIWSQVSQRKKPFSDFPARGPGMYTLS